MRPLWVALALVLPGCAASSGGSDAIETTDASSFGDIAKGPTATTGIVLGVVVDPGIRPIAGAEVLLHGSPEKTTTTTDDGRFAFSDIAPGTYFISASKLNFDSSQVSVDVVAGDANPDVYRIQLQPMFDQAPYSIPHDFEGFIECGYSVRGVISYLCVNDYEKLVTGDDLGPTLNGLIDNRGYVVALDGNWSTLVFELTWEPTSTGTSPAMFILVSWWNRTSSDAYGRIGGPPPNVLLRFETGEEAVGQQGCCEVIPPEGVHDLYPWAGIESAEGGAPVAVGFEQRFHIYQHDFFYGKPPPDWSFVAGDEPPF